MKDLTDSSIVKNILQMALPIAAGMFFQTLYFLIDLYFVAGLGDAAIAGVGAAGNVMFVVFAVTQVLGVGTVTLISHAAGRKDQADANLVFNQSLALAASCAVLTIGLGILCRTLLCEHAGRESRRPWPRELNIFTGFCPVWHCSSPWSPWDRRCAARGLCSRP